MDGTPALLSGTFARRYTVERELGRGASATVYLARDTQRGRAVAIKVLRPELAESLGADRFLREIKVNEKLHHPHIASVLDSGEHDGRLFFVLPHMEGGSLRQLLQREKQLPIEAAIAIARTVAEALDYAHKQGLIHRDVKPENILFTSGQACLVDFGIARAIERAIDESTTETGLVRGTPAYMSPEQASGSRSYDGRSDQYSLACVLYEMLAGVPAFIGPTPEAVIAMRFKHAPRELRVFRSSVSPALEAVIHKALSITAADRYETSGEFGAALETAMRAPHIEPRTSGSSAWNTPSRKWALAGASVFVVALAAAASIGGRAIWVTKTTPDTNKYFVLPIEGDASTPLSQTYDQMLQSLGQWKGVTVVDRFTVRNSLGTDTTLVSDRQAVRAARDAGAGRYIRSRLTRTQSGLRMYGALFDVSEGTRLHEATVSLSLNFAGADAALVALTDQLVLRASPAPTFGSRVLPAVQYYRGALAAREAFDLRSADSLLMSALEQDHGFGQAALMLAQVRTWRREPPSRWQSWAELAQSTKSLSRDDRRLAGGLVAMGQGDADRGCGALETLISRGEPGERDFSKWFSLATCRGSDTVVVRDRRSRSGWRYRSSYNQAVRAYVRAFELAPALHRNFQAGAYSELRNLLYTTRGRLRPGIGTARDTGLFLAYPEWNADSLIFIPYRRLMVIRGEVTTNVVARNTAIAHQRQLFAQIARAWATALPHNAATKEAMAISLDMLGDPSALDTLRAARALAGDDALTFRLAAEEVLLRVSWGRQDARHLQVARQLGDSLLGRNQASGREQAENLAAIAAILGRCREAGRLRARATDPNIAQFFAVSPAAYAATESLTTVTALGCRNASDSAGVSAVLDAVRHSATPRSTRQQSQLEFNLLGRLLRLSVSIDSSRIADLAVASGDYLLRAERHALRRNRDDARTILEEKRRARGSMGTAEISPDVVYAEASVWLAIGDSSVAREWLDPLLNRPSWLELMFYNAEGAASLIRAATIRADLATSGKDSVLARKWSGFVATLWSTADPELHPTVIRMKEVASK